MTPIPINLAVEDRLSEVVLRRLLNYVSGRYAIGTVYGKTGNGYLRRTINGWNNAARGTPFAVLTDLDSIVCPKALIDDWLPNQQQSNLLLRVAVREVESWLLADAENLAKFLHIRKYLIPDNPDTLLNPKETLVNLARKSKLSEIRKRLVPEAGSTARQGRDHNGCLSTFIDDSWDIGAARTHSRSLHRTLAKFESFEPSWNHV